jgi:hypothetical protein
MKTTLSTYTFAPGAPGAGYVTLTGLNIPVHQLLSIVDSTKKYNVNGTRSYLSNELCSRN